jgi:iron(III) transport system permease protein
VTAETAAFAAPREASRTVSFGWLWTTGLLLILTFLVIYPVSMLLLGALTNTNPVVDGFGVLNLSLTNFITVLGNPNVHLALANSMIACGGGTLLAVLIGLTFSWVVVRTDTPCKRFIAAASMIPLFVPPLVGAVAWSILASPKSGLLNTILNWMGISWRFNAYSMIGLIVIFGIYYAPYVYMFTASALRNMDPALEEAAEVSGATAVRILFTITFPLIAPAIISGMLLSFVVMLGIYGIPAVLGAPADIPVLTTYIFKLTNWSPPLYSTAASVAIILMVVTGFLVWLQQRVISARSYITVAGKAFRPGVMKLGRWRYFTLALAVIYLVVVVVLPTLALIVAAFRKFLFIRSVESLVDLKQYSLIHFERLFDNPLALRSIVNTMEVAFVTAVVGGVLAFAIGYTVNRTNLRGRGAINVISTIPVAIPGLVIGVAYLWAWIGLPGGLYGTIWILALAFIARFMPDTIKALSTSMLQIHKELEESAAMSGASWGLTFRRVVLPLLKPGLLAGWIYVMIVSIRELSSSILLYSPGSEVVSIMIWELWQNGQYVELSALGVMLILALFCLVLVAQLVGRRFGIAEA